MSMNMIYFHVSQIYIFHISYLEKKEPFLQVIIFVLLLTFFFSKWEQHVFRVLDFSTYMLNSLNELKLYIKQYVI